MFLHKIATPPVYGQWVAGSGSALLTKGNVYNHMATVRGTAAQITSRDTITHTHTV